MLDICICYARIHNHAKRYQYRPSKTRQIEIRASGRSRHIQNRQGVEQRGLTSVEALAYVSTNLAPGVKSVLHRQVRGAVGVRIYVPR